MYVRSYKTLPQGAAQPDEEKPLDTAAKEEIREEKNDNAEPKEKKSRYKARRKMPDFHPPRAENAPDGSSGIQNAEKNDSSVPQAEQKIDSRTPENAEKTTHVPLYTQSEMLILALAVFLLLEGADDILILALGYTLCP